MFLVSEFMKTFFKKICNIGSFERTSTYISQDNFYIIYTIYSDLVVLLIKILISIESTSYYILRPSSARYHHHFLFLHIHVMGGVIFETTRGYEL